MTRRSEFRVVPPRPKAKSATKRTKAKLSPVPATHKVLGQCVVTAVRLGDSGTWLADAMVGTTRRTLQLSQEHWITNVTEILELAPRAVTPAQPVEHEPKVAAVLEEDIEDREPELGEPDIDDEDDSTNEIEELDAEFA
jgi:hypothetical protein